MRLPCLSLCTPPALLTPAHTRTCPLCCSDAIERHRQPAAPADSAAIRIPPLPAFPTVRPRLLSMPPQAAVRVPPPAAPAETLLAPADSNQIVEFSREAVPAATAQ
jgi:hypothetical protein